MLLRLPSPIPLSCLAAFQFCIPDALVLRENDLFYAYLPSLIALRQARDALASLKYD